MMRSVARPSSLVRRAWNLSKPKAQGKPCRQRIHALQRDRRCR
jgi:hypothetical protein